MALRLAALKDKLSALKYHQPLGVESAPLVDALVNDLVESSQKNQTLQQQAQVQDENLQAAHNQLHPLRRENGRVIRENNQLHLKIVDLADQTQEQVKRLNQQIAQTKREDADLRFLNDQLNLRIKHLEAENSAMRSQLDQALTQNMVVLPDGCEVVWHGPKQHMLAHSPAEPPLQPTPSATVAEKQDVDVVRAAAAHVSLLVKRVESLELELSSARDELEDVNAKVSTRDDEIRRLSKRMEQGDGLEQLNLAHINETNQEAIASLNHRIDFLNKHCSSLERQVESNRLAALEVDQLKSERDLLLSSLQRINDDRVSAENDLAAARDEVDRLRRNSKASSARASAAARVRSFRT